MDARATMLVDRIFKDVAKDIKGRNKKEPQETLKKIMVLLELAKVVIEKYTSKEVVDLTIIDKPKRKYTKKIKVEPGVEGPLPVEKDQPGSVLA